MKSNIYSGMFANVLTKEDKTTETNDLHVNTPVITITYDKFAKTVLPEALNIWINIPYIAFYQTLVTAVDPTAPSILKWGNHVSWYTRVNPVPSAQFRLIPDSWSKVSGLTLTPNHWSDSIDTTNKALSGVLCIIDGAKDADPEVGLALFPEIIRSELHGVRSVIEAYSNNGRMAGIENASASGLSVIGAKLKVKTKLGISTYHIDRMD